jgi:hypothetical protein
MEYGMVHMPTEDGTMAMQKYRADVSTTQSDGAVVWSAQWMGGPSLAKIENCQLINMTGDMRRTVYITGEADTYFSIPAVCSLAGCLVRGYVTGDDAGNLVFRHTYY